MRIPTNPDERFSLYMDLIEKCSVSMDERKSDYTSLRSYYLFGAGQDDSPAHFNKIYSHIDQLTSFLYSADTTRFSISLGAGVEKSENSKVPVLTQALHDEWEYSRAPKVVSEAIAWAMCFSSTHIKLVRRRGNIVPYMVDPANVGVLREDIPYTDRQEAFLMKYYITHAELDRMIQGNPRREKVLKNASAVERAVSDVPNAMNRIILSSTNPTIYGNVNLDLSGMNRMQPKVSEPTIQMSELYVYNDELEDYQMVTIADPGIIVYDRPLWDEDYSKAIYLKGELPFIQVCPNPQYDYYWGQSEVQRLIFLQEMRNKRMGEILDLLSKQVSPPTAMFGVNGIQDEKNFALNRAGGVFTNDMPNGKIERFAPEIPPDLWKEISEIDQMFSEASGISNILSGKGESGVRSKGHASDLARLGSSRAKKRALVMEEMISEVATTYLRLMQLDDKNELTDDKGQKFIPHQFTKDFVVKVDAHSNSPIFVEDLRNLAFDLLKAGAIDKMSLLDLTEPPMKQLLKERLEKLEKQQAQNPPKESKGDGGH
jgi:hypothetical protein